MGVAFPGESAEYRAARDRLLGQEAEMRRAVEAVAAARRGLPQGGKVTENYVFDAYGPEGDPIKVTLAELFAPGKDTLFIYNMMFPRSPDEDLPCPSCTQFLDSFDGVRRAREPTDQRGGRREDSAAARFSPTPKSRGWPRLRLLSSAGNSFNRDYHGESDGRHSAAADDERLPPRRRHDSTHLGFRASCTSRPIPARTRATATRSTRCGTCSTSRLKAAAPPGTRP